MTQVCIDATAYSTNVNGRFRGGWTIREYGKPHTGAHAIQMELVQSAYLTDEAARWTCDAAKAAKLRAPLASILTALAALAPTIGGTT